MINLQKLQNNYKNNLCNKRFHYELSNGFELNIIFYEENMCHLLGLQHVFDKDKRYLGRDGYEKIKDKTLTTADLKKHNEKQYNFIKIKLMHFDELSDLMNNCQIIKFYQERCYPKTQIRADFILYKDNNEYMLQLFAIQEKNTNQYSPTSFVVKTKNDDSYNQYIENQEYKKITNFEITELQYE